MADISVPYDLVTPVGTINFNDSGIDQFNLVGGPDEYYITESTGLDGAPLRTPVDNRPQTHGGLVHPFFKGPRVITIEGAMFIRSTRIQNSVRIIRNDMEKALKDAVDSIIDADGTLSWTPELTSGPDPRTLTVRCNVPVEFRGIELKTFVFGLIAAEPEW